MYNDGCVRMLWQQAVIQYCMHIFVHLGPIQIGSPWILPRWQESCRPRPKAWKHCLRGKAIASHRKIPILGSPMRTKSLHRGAQVQTSVSLAYKPTTTDAPAKLALLILRVATKGTGDTKTEWYYLFSTHFENSSVNTKHSPRSSNTDILKPCLQANNYWWCTS